MANGSPSGAAETIADDITDTIVVGRPSRDWATIWTERLPRTAPPTRAGPPLNNAAHVGAYA